MRIMPVLFRALARRAFSRLVVTRRVDSACLAKPSVARAWLRLCELSRTVEYKCKIGSLSRRTQCGEREKAESVKRRCIRRERGPEPTAATTTRGKKNAVDYGYM